MAESSVSKSVSAVSQNKEYVSNLAHGRGSFIDRIFPLIDEISQFTKMPEWIMNIVMFYFSLQLLSVGLWIYTPIFERVSEKYHSLYNGIISAFTINTPHTYTKFNDAFLILCVVVAAVSICWIISMIVYNNKYYTISEPFLYISSIIIDIIDPIFIIPSAFVLNHGITGLKFGFSINYIAEIIGGSLSCIVLSAIFLLNTMLRSRSVVLSNLLFPSFQTIGIALYIVVNTVFSVISAIFTFFDPWYFVLLNLIHLFIMGYVCYSIWYIPFYHIWRNSLMMSFSITSIVLDINFLVLCNA
ncbi:hypothetical protein TVAG_425640 [Trichomonas vaginalis G3]|uniref:Transmembrane protein n=1 Tax=Trichomonas vaginalis (strain ATCC PRA-98 / G3) TaxID=412133 RepID=A2FI97_TRIV3|nr:guanylate cyclase protein [Trichomonas vaginalis G3]EAX95379.1 hypothetical protein TVAG_425640 [Trichomonas vaginalis G3]KAI5510747.1 guanylate cyclase protein [Trichomonas vaginalis G3]|eukprot:XP_001308309.1 hypothetical protein [Trichomonas vaginalis G3]